MTRRHALVRAAAALAALAVLAGIAGPVGGPAWGAPPVGTRAATSVATTTPDAAVGVHLRRQAPLGVEASGTQEITVRLDGTPPADAEVAVSLHRRVTDRASYQAAIEGQSGSVVAVLAFPLADLPRTATGDVLVAVPLSTRREAGKLRIQAPGVYPVTVEVRDRGDNVLAGFTTPLVRLPEEPVEGRLSVGLVVPLAAAPTLAPDGTRAAEAAATDSVREVAALLDRHRAVPLTVVPVPETMESLANATDAGAERVMTTLRGALGDREVVAGPYVELDPASFVEAGLTAELTAQVTRGTEALTEALAPIRPTVQTWVADHLGASAVAALRDLRIDRVVLRADALLPPEPAAVPSTTRAGSTGRTTTTTLSPTDATVAASTTTRPVGLEAGGVRLASVATFDAGLSARLAAGGGAEPTLAAQVLLAEAALVWFEHGEDPTGGHGVVLQAPADWRPDAAFVDAVMTGLAAHPLLAPVTLDTWFRTVAPAAAGDGTAVVRTLAPAAVGDLGSWPASLGAVRTRLAGYVSMLGRPNGLAVSQEDRLAVSASARLTAEGRLAYLDAVDDALGAELAKVLPPERQSVTLTSRSAEIPLVLRSNAGYPVQVAVRLSAAKLAFPDGDLLLVTLTDEATTVKVHVESRATGTFPLDVELLSPDGRVHLGSERVTVRSTAFSGVGAILSIGALVVLVGWWARHARTTRRARRLVPEPPHTADANAPAADAADYAGAPDAGAPTGGGT